MTEPDGAENESTTRQRTGQSSTFSATDARAAAGAGTAARGWDTVVEHVSSHKIDFILAITRFLTVLFTLSYLLGIPGPASSRYKQALLMCAATSSFRLHQRMPPPPLNQLNTDYLRNLIKEDSFHYLVFPFMFFLGKPITLVLLPCALYALFNLAVYAISILDKLGNQEPLRLEISNFVAKYQQSLLSTIALSELALMPTVIISLFTGVVYLFTPLLYYRFLIFRYRSARNAHLKELILKLATNPFVSNLLQQLGRFAGRQAA